MNIFNLEFLYTAYIYDTTFFLKDKISVFETLNVFYKFSLVSGLSPNTTKCETDGIGTLRGVNVALCGVKSLNLTKETVKILGVHFSYNKTLQHEMNFPGHIGNIESVLRLWRIRNLTIEGKVLVFKSLAISKKVQLSFLTTVPHAIINQLKNIQKNFIWNRKNPKIKHSTLSNSYKNGGLKNVDVFTKGISLQCSWIKKLYDENIKITPSYLIKTIFCENFKFHTCLEPSIRSLKNVPDFYKDMITNWAKCLSCSPSSPSAILSQFLWFNLNIKIDNKSIFVSGFASKNINFVGQTFHENGKAKSWDYIKSE